MWLEQSAVCMFCILSSQLAFCLEASWCSLATHPHDGAVALSARHNADIALMCKHLRGTSLADPYVVRFRPAASPMCLASALSCYCCVQSYMTLASDAHPQSASNLSDDEDREGDATGAFGPPGPRTDLSSVETQALIKVIERMIESFSNAVSHRDKGIYQGPAF